MAFTTPITAVTGATILDTDWNTSMRDNLNAVWKYTAAGDTIVGASATTTTKLARPASTSIFQEDSSGVASWLPKINIAGIHAKGTVDFSVNMYAGGWVDVTGSTITLTLTVTCTIIVIAGGTGYCDNTGYFEIRTVIDGTTDGFYSQNQGPSVAGGRNEYLSWRRYKTGVTAGSRSIKMQFTCTSGAFFQGRLIVLAFVEP